MQRSRETNCEQLSSGKNEKFFRIFNCLLLPKWKLIDGVITGKFMDF